MARIGINWIFAAFLATLCSALCAQVAQVERASGELRVRSGLADAKPLLQGQSVAVGDAISTGKGSALLRFTDGQTIALAENSSLRINNYQFDANAAQNSNSAVGLLRGAMRMLTGLIGKRNPAAVRVSTPTATIGIRGTDFITSVQEGASANTNTAFTQVIDGSIEMSTQGGSIVAKAGEVVSATGNAAPVASSAAAMEQASGPQLGALQQLSMLPAAGATGGRAGAGGAAAASSGGISAVSAGFAGLVGAAAIIGGNKTTTGTTGTR